MPGLRHVSDTPRPPRHENVSVRRRRRTHALFASFNTPCPATIILSSWIRASSRGEARNVTSSLTCAGAAIWTVEAFEGPASLLGSDPHIVALPQSQRQCQCQSQSQNRSSSAGASASASAHASDWHVRVNSRRRLGGIGGLGELRGEESTNAHESFPPPACRVHHLAFAFTLLSSARRRWTAQFLFEGSKPSGSAGG